MMEVRFISALLTCPRSFDSDLVKKCYLLYVSIYLMNRARTDGYLF